MALTLPAITPSFSPSLDETPNVQVVSFDDGYEQRIGVAINPIKGTVSIPWRAQSQVNKDTLINFFRARKGTEWFWWTVPGETVPRKFVASKWSFQRTPDAKGHYDVSADFREVFDFQ